MVDDLCVFCFCVVDCVCYVCGVMYVGQWCDVDVFFLWYVDFQLFECGCEVFQEFVDD